MNHGPDLVCPNTHPPPLVGHHIVHALRARVAGGFERVPGVRARGRRTVAGPYVDGVGRVPKVVGARVLARLGVVCVGTGRHGQAQTARGQRLRHGLEGDRGHAVGQAQERGDGAAE